jgi:hypothetical protein
VFGFLVDTYDPHETPSASERHLKDVSLAAERLSETEAEVRMQE